MRWRSGRFKSHPAKHNRIFENYWKPLERTGICKIKGLFIVSGGHFAIAFHYLTYWQSVIHNEFICIYSWTYSVLCTWNAAVPIILTSILCVCSVYSAVQCQWSHSVWVLHFLCSPVGFQRSALFKCSINCRRRNRLNLTIFGSKNEILLLWVS